MQLPLPLEAYSPRIHLGDWQIVVFVDRRRGRISVQRRHSSENNGQPIDKAGDVLRIDTGIRAFRRHMPVLAAILENIEVDGLSDAKIVQSVFRGLATLYKAVPEHSPVWSDEAPSLTGEFADFFQHHENAVLTTLR